MLILVILFILFVFELFLLLLLLLLINKINNINSLKNLNKINIENLYNICKTGDMIYFRYKSVKLLDEIFSKYTHVGLVVELNGKKYIFESHLKGDAKNMGIETDGVHLHDLIDRINTFEGNTYYSKLKYDIDKDIIDRFVDNIDEYKKIKFQSSYRRYIIDNCLLDRIYNKCICKNTNKKFCSEFVMFCLYELKIVKNNCSHCVFPDDFINLMVNDELVYDKPELIDLKTKI
jgi:hypothetical protein